LSYGLCEIVFKRTILLIKEQTMTAKGKTIGIPGRLPRDRVFQTDAESKLTAMGFYDRMMSPSDCVRALQVQGAQYKDWLVPEPAALNLKWDHEQARYFIEPNPATMERTNPLRDWFGEYKRMPVTKTGFASACKRIKRGVKVWEAFSEPHARFLSEFYDWYRRGSSKGLIVRTMSAIPDGGVLNEGNRGVEAFVPQSFDCRTDYEVVSAIILRIQQSFGSCLRGVQCLRDGDIKTDNLRLIFGDPIMVEPGGDGRLIFPMLNLILNPCGLEKAQVMMGAWRMVCYNGMGRDDSEVLRIKWFRTRSDGFDTFLRRVSTMIHAAPLVCDVYSKAFREMMGRELGVSGQEIVGNLRDRNLIGKEHASIIMHNLKTVDVETDWDLFNVLTDTAKALPSMTRRMNAEATSLRLAMQPRGFAGIYRDGFNTVEASGQMHLLN
jgi:hypothetical protein